MDTLLVLIGAVSVYTTAACGAPVAMARNFRSIGADSQVVLSCFDSAQHPVGKIKFSAESQVSSGDQNVCNGGVGDAVTCRESANQTEVKTAYISIGDEQNKIAGAIQVHRTIWDGAPTEPWAYFSGEGNLARGGRGYQVTLESADGGSACDYQLLIDSASGVAQASTQVLGCSRESLAGEN